MKTKNKKGKLALIIVATLLAAAVLCVSVWLISVDCISKDINLVKVNGLTSPEPLDVEPEEYDVELEDITVHYAKCGSGYPLLLIHGNGNSHKDLEDLALRLANDYTVYALDSRSQGQSTYTDEISYQLMAKDVMQFIKKLGLVKPYVIGHSDGGIVAIQMAIDYPDLLGAFVACGANSNPSGLKGYFTIQIRARYAREKKPLDRIMVEEPNFTKESLSEIKTPAYVLAGEFDIVKLKDTKFLADNIPGAKVAVLKWQGHSSYIKQNAQRCYALAKDFFDSL